MDGVLESIFTVNLGVKKDEKVLVFTDLVREDEAIGEDEKERRSSLREISREVAERGRALCDLTYIEFPSVSTHGAEPPVEVWEAAFGKRAVKEIENRDLLNRILKKSAEREDIKAAEAIINEYAESPGAVVALSNYSTSHTRFRDFLTRCKRTRYASMPLFERSMLEGAMRADWKRVEERTLSLVGKLNGADTVIITSHNGTSITFSVKDRVFQADTGILTEPGSFGNLPAGEAFIAPVEGTAEGTLILEWAPTRKLRKSVSLEVKKGVVVEISGEEEFTRDLKKKLSANPLCGNIAELGIGTNDKAARPDNILETEKMLGTIHIALGDNSSFGGHTSVPYHQDFIFFRPTLEALNLKKDEKTEILIEGEPRF